MAFTGNISEANSQIGIQSGTRQDNPLEGVASLLSRVSDRAAQQKAKEDELAKGRAIGATQNSILDLENERNALALEDQQLSAQVQSMYQDGITPEEEATLKDLQKQRDKLKLARQTGVLNPLNYQTRLNALQKQALANVDLLNIQPQINALFGQARSTIEAPIPTSQVKFEQEMNSLYGTNNWSGADAGMEQGKAINMQRIQANAYNNFQTFIGNESLAYMSTADGAVRRLRTVMQKNGSIQEADVDMYMANINNKYQQMMREIDMAVATNRKNGVPIDPEEVKKAKEQVTSTYSFYADMVKDKQEFGDNTRFLRRLENMNRIVSEVATANNPAFAQLSSAIGGSGGTGGDLALLAELASTDNKLLNGVAYTMSTQGVPISANALKEQAARVVAMALQPFNFKDAAEQGLVDRRLALMVAAKGIKVTDNPVALNNYVSAFDMSEYDTAASAAAALVNAAPNLKANKIDMNRMATTIANIGSSILDEISPEEAKYLSVNKDGVLYIDESKIPVHRKVVGTFSIPYTNKALREYDRLIKTYPEAIKDPLQYKMELLNNVRSKAGLPTTSDAGTQPQ